MRTVILVTYGGCEASARSRINVIIPLLALDADSFHTTFWQNISLDGDHLLRNQMLMLPSSFTARRGESQIEYCGLGRVARQDEIVRNAALRLHLRPGTQSPHRRPCRTTDEAGPCGVEPETKQPPNVEGKGGAKQRELVINALRMRPDRVVIGEVRGAEALDMLQAMNTGHDGSITTIHANTPRDALSRLEETMAMMERKFAWQRREHQSPDCPRPST